jgi:hypothetical protein
MHFDLYMCFFSPVPVVKNLTVSVIRCMATSLSCYAILNNINGSYTVIK